MHLLLYILQEVSYISLFIQSLMSIYFGQGKNTNTN